MNAHKLSLLVLLVASPLWADLSFDYFDNSWSVVGLRDYAQGTRITPDNRLLIGAAPGTRETEADKASVQFRFGRDLRLLGREQTKRLMEGWLPVVLLEAREDAVRYEFTFWATPLPSAKHWKKAFDGPIEGGDFLTWAAVRAVNTGNAECEAKLRIEQSGSFEALKHPVPGLATPRTFAWSLKPGACAECAVAIPWIPGKIAEHSGQDARVWLKRCVGYWREALADAASIRVPCEKASQAWLASHVCQLIASDLGELHGGEGFYDEFYIRDGAYQVMELEEAGLWDAARKGIRPFIENQREDGRFESQKNQFDANGQCVWALWQYYKITGDTAWLKSVYPGMRKAVDWTIQARRGTLGQAQFAGLLPAAPADGESLWDGTHHILGYDFWNLRGIWCAADAARILGKTAEAGQLQQEAAEYRAAIDRAWGALGVPHFPPSWEKAGTHWGNTETLWPTPIFAPEDPRVGASIGEVRTKHLGGFLEGTIRWTDGKMLDAIHPYMSAYTTMASLIRGEHEQVVEDFYWYLLHSTATHGFPEGILQQRRFAWSSTIPHVTGASNFALMFRHMLIHEQGDELHLLSAAPDWWLDAGQEIAIERAPTHFGPMNLKLCGTERGIRMRLEAPARQTPARIVLHLPESRPLESPVRGVEVRMRANQTRRIDFPEIIRQYRAGRP